MPVEMKKNSGRAGGGGGGGGYQISNRLKGLEKFNICSG